MQQESAFIEKQAYDWLVKLETGKMAVGDEDRFVDWLSEDEKHAQAFHQVEKAWQLMHQVGAGEITSNERPAPAKKNKLLRLVMPIAATVLLTLSSLFWGQTAFDATFSDYYTATGKRQQVTLPDGTLLTLNTDSAVDIQYTNDVRTIILKRGEVYVDVAPDKARPLTVDAGLLKVTALGTEFMVNKHNKAKPSVTVTEHSVKVENANNSADSMVVNTGQKATILSERNVISLTDELNTEHEKSWLKGKYVFTNQTVEQVISELSRYHAGTIIIRNEEIKQMTISGVLNLEQPLTSLQGLTDILPIKINTITPYVIMIERV